MVKAEKEFAFQCTNNPEHLFEKATDDLWCPYCDISTRPMLVPYAPPVTIKNEKVSSGDETLVSDRIETKDNPDNPSKQEPRKQDIVNQPLPPPPPPTPVNKPVKDKPDLPSVNIGGNIWMQAFLNVTRFRNGNELFHAKDDKEWVEAHKNRIPAWRYPHEDSTLGSKAGLLYNFYAVSHPDGLAPDGWDIPTVDDAQKIGSENAVLFLENHLKNIVEKVVFHSLAFGTQSDNVGKTVLWTKTPKLIYTSFAYVINPNAGEIDIRQYDKNAGFFVRCIKI
jgi:uncharacterized protein (TIGR02145 family)